MSKPILIIEDNKKHRFFLERMLKSAGYQVETAKNNEEVSKKMCNPQRFGLVTVDILVPRFNVTDFITSHFHGYGEGTPDPKLLVLSAYAESEEYADKFPKNIKKIRKPFDFDDLLKEIKKILPEDEIKK